MQTRRTISWLSRVANRIFNLEKGWKNDGINNEESIVAFMGDGQFKHQKGYAPVPKKKLIKTLATKGMTVVLDEFRTSSECPCGNSELDNIDSDNESYRLRRHKTFEQGNPCCVECSIGSESMDRDVLAVINFCLCATASLHGQERPNHLCRPKRTFWAY